MFSVRACVEYAAGPKLFVEDLMMPGLAVVRCAACQAVGKFQGEICFSCNGSGGVAVFLTDKGTPYTCVACKGTGRDKELFCNSCGGCGCAGRLDRMLERAAGLVKLK